MVLMRIKKLYKKEILGPSWAPKKDNILKANVVRKDLSGDEETSINEKSVSQENYEKRKRTINKSNCSDQGL